MSPTEQDARFRNAAMPLACPLCGAIHAAEQACAFVPAQPGADTLALAREVERKAAAPASAEDLLGAVVGNFRIVRLLGQGGMGAVYLGEHTVIGSKVAMKFLHPHIASDAGLVQRFFAEARAVNLVGHENIVSVLDLGLLPPGRYYLVMELLEGAPLHALLGSPFTLEASTSILSQICDALQAAHDAGVVHRDLKPENVFLVQREGRDDFVKLVDFGIARLSNAETGLTAAGFVVGTPEYMAPEQWASSAVDGRADIYALGLIAYALATGRLPFYEETPLAYFRAHSEQQPVPPRTLNPSLPPAFEAAILKALAKSPGDRFQKARDFKQALRAAAIQGPLPARLAAPTPTASHAAAAAAAARAEREVDVRFGGEWRHALKATDVTTGGMLVVASPPFPPLMSKVSLRLPHPGGTLETEAEVVRHISPEQAEAWRTSAGFALQYAPSSSGFRASLGQLLKGQTPTQSAAVAGDDPVAEPVLAPYRKTLSGDPYALLGVPQDASCTDVHQRLRQATWELEALADRALSFAQRMAADQALGKLTQAAELLGSPERRAAFDAGRGNFRGVARCLNSGLRASDAERLRREYLATHPRNETGSRLRMAAGRALEGANEPMRALAEYEAALTLDPLSLEAHHAYWGLKRRLGSS